MKATSKFDALGARTGLTYVAPTGTEMAAFSSQVDSQSRVRTAESTGSKQLYTYDDRDRLTSVQDTTGGNCITREYGFSLDSNRATLSTSGPNSGGACTTSESSAKAAVFDDADRIIDPGYSYDALGRTRTVPAVHTDQPSGSALTVNYYSNDMVANLAQSIPNGAGGTTARSKSFTLDASDRVSRTIDSTAGVELRKTTNHYSDNEDSPSWIETETRGDSSGAWTTSWSRNVAGPDGSLAIIQPSTGGAKLQIANLRGDIVATVDNGAFGGFTAWAEPTEYGLAKNPSSTLSQNYGWLGTSQRSGDTIGGLILMGARLYNPVTGRFLSRDPVPGGNDNSYAYPVDPVNFSDPSGACPMCAPIVPIVLKVGSRAWQAKQKADKAKKAKEALDKAKKAKKARKPSTKAGDRRAKNSGKEYPSKAEADRAAKKYAGGRKSCEYRGECSSRDHVHVDKFDRAGRKTHTRHYYYPPRPISRLPKN
jgi:RHS repeat-associated protein